MNSRRAGSIERMRAASVAVDLRVLPDATEKLYFVSEVTTQLGVGIVARQKIPSGTLIYKGLPFMYYNNVEVDGIGLAGALFFLEKIKLNSLISMSEKLYPRNVSDMNKYMDKKYFGDNGLGIDSPVSIIYAKTDHNAFSLGGVKMGMYSLGSSFNHSCRPNCYNSVSNVSHYMVILAARDINEGEECTIIYNIDLLNERDSAKRIRILEGSMFFTCKCMSCTSLGKPGNSREVINYCSAVTGNKSRCEGCDIPASTLKCSRCKSVYYCSKECQLARWPRHKVVCNAQIHS